MARFSLCLATVALLACSVFADDEHVITLSGKTFADAVKKHDKLVVEFYAPWCGHCKSLAPEYEKAAGVLKESGITLAKVDATEADNKELAQKFGVQGFPTLKVFMGDDKASDYNGPRDADGIVSYVKKLFGPPSAELKTEEEVTTEAAKELTVLGVFPKGESSPEYKTFVEVAKSLRDDGNFAHVFNAKLVKDCASCSAATILLYKDWDTKMTKYTGKFVAKDITEFIEKTTTPELVSLDRTNKNKKALSKIFADQLPKLLGSAPADHKDIEAFKKNLIAIGKAHPKIHVLYMDPKGNEGALNFFGVKEADLPAILVHEPESNGKLMEKNIKLGDMLKWAEKYSKGEIERTIKSEDIPEKNDGPVTVLVAKEFEKYVTSGKDVLIEFYAPWCGHCKKLEPIYEQLGKAFEKDENIVIAKMDATANDVPDVPGMKFNVKGFPTLYFVQGSSKKVLEFSGDRSLEGLKKYVKKNANPDNLSEPLTAEEAAAEPAAEEAGDGDEEDYNDEDEDDDEYDDDEEYDDEEYGEEDGVEEADEYEDVDLEDEEKDEL